MKNKENKHNELEIDGEKFLSTILHWRSEQIRLASRSWISLALVSIYVIGAVLGQKNELKLPFIDIEFPKDYFILVMTGFIAAFSTRWLEIENRQIILFKKVIEKFYLDSENFFINGTFFNTKELIDSFTITNTSAVWSSPAQLLESKCTFIRYLALPLLFLLKMVSVLIHFGLPIVALGLILDSSSNLLGWIKWSIIFLVFISFIQLLIGLINNLKYARGSVKSLSCQLKNIRAVTL